MRKLVILSAAVAALGTAAVAQPSSGDRDYSHGRRMQDDRQNVRAHEARMAQQDRFLRHRAQERARNQAIFREKERERLAYEARHHMGRHDHDRDYHRY